MAKPSNITLFRVKVTCKGADRPTKFYTGSPITFYLPKYFPSEIQAASAACVFKKDFVRKNANKGVTILNIETVPAEVRLTPQEGK